MTMLGATFMDDNVAASPGTRYALAGRIITGDGTPSRTDHAVLVDDGVITDVLPASAVRDRRILDFPGKTIMPGVINAHCHNLHDADERRERWLEHGVTAIGDVASPLAAMALLADSPPGRTATASMSGPMLTAPGGYPLPVHSPDHAMPIVTPGQARDAVQLLADRGARMIKMSFEPGVLSPPWPLLDAPTAAAVCDTARRLGLVVRCHVEDFSGLEPALRAGVHVIDHVPCRWSDGGRMRSIFTGGNDSKELIEPYRRLLGRMVRDDVILVPTLDVLSRSIWKENTFEPVRAFHELGGRVAVGNDFPYRRTDAGMVLQEIRLLAKAGLSGATIINGATGVSASACNFADRGVLAKGMAADMLMVDGDPQADPDTLAAPVHIIKDGDFVCEIMRPWGRPA